MINDRPPKSVLVPPAITSLIARLGGYSSVAGSNEKERKKTKTDSCKKSDKRLSTSFDEHASFDEHTSLNNCCFMFINLHDKRHVAGVLSKVYAC